jgi:hypothetical protein
MNLLGMKRKLLPYGMALGGGMAGSALGAMGSASPSSSSGGKSAPVAQNKYGDSFQAPTGSGAISPMPIMNGKSSGAGQGGYGAAPAFQQPTAQTQPSFEQSPFPSTPLNSSVNTTTQQDMMGGNRGGGQGFGQLMQALRGGMPMMGGGKSSGLGQGGYGMAPAFNDMGGGFQQPQQQFNSFQQQQTPESLYAANMGMPPPPPQRGISGLQSLYGNMMNQQQQMQRQPMQRMPRFQSQALQYRPDMTQAQAALSRVKPSVQKQEQDAQAARIAELEAQLAGYQTPSGE